MISEAEVKRLAGKLQLNPMIIDLDYALSCALAGIFKRLQLTNILIFKGGTCLKKCYFEDYRFSEDIDFTIIKRIPLEVLKARLYQIIPHIEQDFGLSFLEREPKWEILKDEYGKESVEMRFYYRGPLRWQGDPRAIRIDISYEEIILFEKEMKSILHSYSDKVQFQQLLILCYSLDEILLEKLRALLGQRKFAIARDLFDIGQLLNKKSDLKVDQNTLAKKFQAKGIDFQKLQIEFLHRRRDDFKAD